MILDFFEIMEKRSKKYTTLILAYQIKILQEVGSMPQVNRCVRCGEKEEPAFFSVKDGGIICKSCCLNFNNYENDSLIYSVNFV
jgi:DNA repair protein RecO (recombination protein O)